MCAYNVKLIEYPNGSLQVRYYSSPLVNKESNDCEDELDFDLNPFTGKETREIDNLDELDNVRHSKEETEARSFRRTLNNIYDYARCINWGKFVTFTFNKEKVDRYNFDECSRLVRRWLRNQRRNAPDLQYLLVPELHEDGAIHFHGLLANTGKMKFVDSGKRTKDKQVIYNMASWSNGFTTAIDVYNTHGVSKYIGKYITKDLCKLTKGKNRYFISANLPKPKTCTFLVTDNNDFNDLLDTISNSYGVEIVHVSQPRKKDSYVDVDYYELQERKA